MSNIYQVLIVDDEIDAVTGVKSSVDWDALDISNVYSAYNIRQAKEIIKNHEIDIIICDIEMPQGNGLELLSWVKDKYPATIAAFLTCHADFKYAQLAVQLGVIDYILKPISSKSLVALIEKAKNTIEKRKQQAVTNESYKHYYQLWATHQPLLIEHFWLDLLDRTILSSPDSIKWALNKIDIPDIEQQKFVPLVIHILHRKTGLSSLQEKDIEHDLKKKTQEVFSQRGHHEYVLALKKGIFLVLRDGNNHDKRSLLNLCQGYVDIESTNFDCDIFCYIGTQTAVFGIADMVDKLLTLSLHHVASKKRIFFINDPILTSTIEIPIMDEWAELFIQGEKQKVYEKIDGFLDSISNIDHLHIEVLNVFYHNFIQVIYFTLQKKNLHASKIFTSEELEFGIGSTHSVLAFKEWIHTVVNKLMGYISSQPYSIVKKVKEYVSNHIGEGLSREEIAEHVHLHPDYLSRSFKKETGETISEYIISERIKVAKDLLVNTKMPIGEIASQIGYSNFSHFSKVFKGETGVKPLDFRNKVK